MLTRFLAVALVAGAVGAVPALAQRRDAHYLLPEEYFVAEQAYNGGILGVMIARQVSPPGADNEALFMAVAGPRPAGQRFRSRHFWRTRVAAARELEVGKVVFCLDLANDDNVYRAPENRDEALQGGWWMGTITDVSDLQSQGEVRVGERRASLNCLRVVAQ